MKRKMLKIVIIDGQGGRLGQLLVEAVKKKDFDAEIYAIGTNSTATSQMLRAGADYGATGENPVIVASRDADFIIGPIGIVAADSLLGEVTPKMVTAIGRSGAEKILIPVGHCNNHVAGVKKLSMTEMADAAVDIITELLSEKH